MKTHSGSLSCSCTSCTYRSESERPSLRRLIAQGSPIDRLYYGKYIPLREKKLLERLVRTRGVYDVIRAQLVSDSTISLDTKAVLKPRKKLSARYVEDKEKNRAILQLVDQVDKGEKLGSKELSGCCSCCSCSSKINVHLKSASKQRHYGDHLGDRHGYARKNTGGVYNRKGVRFKAKHIRSEPCTCTYKLSGMIKKISKKRRPNQHLTLVDLKPNTYEEISQRPGKVKNFARLSYEKIKQSKVYAQDMMVEGVRKFSESKTNLQEKFDLRAKKSLEKVHRVKSNIKDKVNNQKKLSKILKQFDMSSCSCPDKDLIPQIKKDSISKFRDDLKKKELMKNWECEHECIEDTCDPEKCFYKLKHKLPRLLGRTKQEGKQNDIIMKELMIAKSIKRPSIEIATKKVAEITVPREVFKQKPLLRAQQNAVDKKYSKVTKGLKKQQNKNEFCDCKRISSQRNIKSGTNLSVSAFQNKNDKSIHINQTSKIEHSPKTGIIIINKRRKNIGPKEEQSQRQVVRIGSSFSFNIEFYKNRNVPAKDKLDLSLQRSIKPSYTNYSYKRFNKNEKLKTVSRHRHNTSQVKSKQKSKNTTMEENYLKRCFCKFKLKPKRNKIKNTKKERFSKESNMAFTPQLLNVETNTSNTYINDKKYIKKRQKMLRNNQYLLPYECEPGVCEPDDCDPYKCIKLINMRKKKAKTRSILSGHLLNDFPSVKDKSTTSFSTRSHSPVKNKYVQPEIQSKNRKNRNEHEEKRNLNSAVVSNTGQVVRIGSSMSFNMEFYKNKIPHSIKPDISKTLTKKKYPKTLKTKDNQKSVAAISHTYKPLHNKTRIDNTLKRCFCTFKLQDRKYIKRKKNKKIITDTEMIDSLIIITSDKGTKTKRDRRLKSYECEPFVCIPGACDPYRCLERINQRKLKEIGSMANRIGTKTVSSITYPKKSLKNIHIQSKPRLVDRKALAVTKTSQKNKHFNKYASSALNNQSVKIGSTFSFNIDFYKTNDNSKEPLNFTKSTLLLGNKIKKINKLNVAHVYTQKKEAKKLHKSSTASHIVKRCFCTLNLQKYRKTQPEKRNLLERNIMIPKEYTINRALINPVLVHKKSYDESKPNSSSITFPFQQILSSIYSASVKEWVSNSIYLSPKHTSSSYLEQKEITNLSQYVRNCFCTMNLQLANKKMAHRKLKSESVKLGSNFGFNIDLFKNCPRSETENLFRSKYSYSKVTNLARNRIKTIGTKEKVAYRNQKSQSGSDDIMPTRRCFCMFKLQKKGRWQNSRKQNLYQPSTSKTTVKSVDKAQNTKFKPMNIAHTLKPYECKPNICTPGVCNPYQCLEIMKRKKYKRHVSFSMLAMRSSLKPYECEPNICVPGECNPYRCLEMIKKRNYNRPTKESGVDIAFQAKRSVANMTQRNHVARGTQKAFREKEKNNNTYSSKKSNVLKPSRQIVRVGSNMSFSVEFFKDQNTPLNKNSNNSKNSILGKRKHDSSSQISKTTRYKHTEIRKLPKLASTMTTSFLKRCFCTAQLHKENQTNKTINYTQDISSRSFLKKCFCALKSMKISKTPKDGIHIQKIPHSNKKIDTTNTVITEELQHHPYECEPGICVPGECDPYECEKKIKSNRMKNAAALTVNKTRSVFTYSPSILKKNARIQSRTNNKQAKKTDLLYPAPFVKHCDRQAIKIGSNFSFNIEFYKDKHPNSSKSLKSMKYKSLSSYDDRRPKLNNKKLKHDIIPTHPRLTKSISSRKSAHATKGQYFLKRCFCTLRLHSQHAHDPGIKVKKIIKYDEFNTKSIMTDKEKGLDDIACEPNICVPYQCDPYECEKIMKLRRKEQYRETGVLAGSIKNYSVRTMTDEFKRQKRKTQTVGRENLHRNLNSYENDEISPRMQKVKIGSSFDFNIEFLKDNDCRFNVNGKSVPMFKTKENCKKKSQMEKDIRRHKQAQGPKLKKQSTSSQTKGIDISILKRCFCTLFFKKPKGKPIPLKSLASNVGTETRKLPKKVLLPYECEPQICIPGECDAYECLERIKKRNSKSFGAYKNSSENKNIASVTAHRTKLKTKKNQYNSKCRSVAKYSQLKTSANCKKQAVRIGSNFNFNVEFYKGKNGPINKSTINTIQNYSSSSGNKFTEVKSRKQQIKKCDESNCPELKKVHKFTQPNETEKLQKKTPDKNKNSHKFLKKCFCVLKLYKMRNKKQNFNKNYAIPSDRDSKNTPKQNLLSFECQPNVCVLEECDPYECDKLIKNRLLKEKREMNRSKAVITDKLKSKSIRLQAPKTKLKEYRQNTKSKSEKAGRNISEDTDKRVVRVGSTFSFDIEFFKDLKNCKEKEINTKTKNKRKLKNNKTFTENKKMISRASKAYKRLPECDTYKEKKRKSCSVSTQVLKKCADECIGILGNNIYKTRNRSSHTDKAITLPTLRGQKRGLKEVPRSRNNLNKQAVRIGSNFSFNIEFYKRTPSQIRQQNLENLERKIPTPNKREYLKDIAYTNDKNVITSSPLTRNHRSQAVVETGEKSLNAQNALNRCFCTLKLQSNVHTNKRRQNAPAYIKTPPFPQTFEVRRFNVTQKGLCSKKGNSFRTVATKINKNYITEDSDLNQRCNCSFRKNTLPTGFTEMETILPYKSKKFKKTTSKTLLQVQNNYSMKKRRKGTKTINNGKNLNRKKSQNNIYSEKQPFNFKTFLCRCAAIFTSKNKNNHLTHVRSDMELKDMKTNTKKIKRLRNNGDRLKFSKSDGRPPLNQNPKLKQSNSLKLDCSFCKKCILQNKDVNETKNQHAQSKLKGMKNQEKNNQMKRCKSYKEEHNTNFNYQNQHPFKCLKNNKFDQLTCDYCRAYMPVDKEILDSTIHGVLKKSKIRKDKISKIFKEEIQKGAGDRPTDSLNQDPRNNHKNISGSKIHGHRNYIICNQIIKQKPLFEMQLSSDDYDIINKEEVMDNVAKLTLQKSYENHKKQKNVKEKKGEKILGNEASQSKKSSKSNKDIPAQTHSFKSKTSLTPKLDNKKNHEICNHCRKNIKEKSRRDKSTASALKVHFMDTISTHNKEDKSLSKNKLKSDRKSNIVSESQQRIQKEIKNDAGDRPTFDKNRFFYQTQMNKLKGIFKRSNDDTDNVCSGKIEQKPLFEMHLSSGDYDIINKEQFMDNVAKYGSRSKTNKDQLSKSHKKSCRCCICISKKNGAYVHVSPKRSMIRRSIGKLYNTPQSPTLLPNKPCTCGSLVCSKKLKEMHAPRKLHRRYFWKPCVCGSPVCDRESASMRAISPDKVTCICEEVYKRKKNKMKVKRNKMEAKQHAARRKLLDREDKVRRRKRFREDKQMEKRINKKASDLVLLAESVIDIGKLGITACTDILRSVARTASDPKHAYYTLKAMKEDPKLMSRHLKTAYADSGVAATARRVRLRCLAMRGVKKVKNTLERYAVTNYLLHIADSDPKKRLIKKKRPQRLRERLDFGCSLYMASLRKKPYLSVYDRCPWFYPHFLSLLNVWKQFADITLFLLAVVVWSPCILCMELCRAMMCCFFCTG